MRCLLLILISSCLLGLEGFCGTRYVDFSGGNDANDGLTTTTAWRHIKGDANATGNAASFTPSAGDTIYFKPNVVYTGVIAPGYSGATNNPITFQGVLSSWAAGRAILDGISGGTTNSYGFSVEGKFITVSGFEVRNFTAFGIRLYDGTPNSATVSNNVVHHIGFFPYDPSIDSGTGITVNKCRDALVVSNEVYLCNLKGINGNNEITNTIVWGNHIHDCQDDGINLWAWGFTLIGYNTIHDCTNTVRHADGMQILGFPPGSPLVVVGNFVYDCTQGYFIEPFSATEANPSSLVLGQIYRVITNNAFYFGPDVRYSYNGHTYVPGDRFTAVGTSPGTWLADQGGIQTYFPAGKAYLLNNIFTRTLGKSGAGDVSGLDSYSDCDLFWVVGNTLHRGHFDNSPRDKWGVLTNSVFLNNLMVDSIRGAVTFNGGTSTDDYNQHTNSNSNMAFGGNLTLPQFQAANPGHEVHSMQGPVSFVDAPNYDFHLASSAGIGAGTVVSNPDFTFLPAPWLTYVNAGKDRDGLVRGSTPDIGAYQFVSSSSTVTPPVVVKGGSTRGAVNLHVVR